MRHRTYDQPRLCRHWRLPGSLGTVLVCLLASTAGGAEIAGLRPEEVPPSLLDGDRLVLEEWGCSVEAPSSEWTWVRMAAGEITPAERGYSEPYYAINVGKSVPLGFYVALHTNGGHPDEPYMNLLAEELDRIARSNEASIEGFKYAPSEIPLPGSQRFTYTTTWADGSEWHGFGYVGGSEKKFIFSVETPSEAEPVLFLEFVGSFRLLQEPRSGAKGEAHNQAGGDGPASPAAHPQPR